MHLLYAYSDIHIFDALGMSRTIYLVLFSSKNAHYAHQKKIGCVCVFENVYL